jgi:hypothetical protein
MLTIYVTLLKNIKLGIQQIKIWLVCIACSIPKATNAHPGCVILVALSQQQWHERASVFSHMPIAFLVKISPYLFGMTSTVDSTGGIIV